MWAARLLVLLATAQLALAVDGSRDAFRQRVCMVSEVGAAPDSGAARVWWWVRFLLQELLDWATSLTASAAAIAACAVLLRRTDPQPAPRPRVVNFLAEALQGGKSWASIPRRLQFGFVTTTPDRRPSRGVQTPSRPTLNEGASSEETVSQGVQASPEGSVEDTHLQEETTPLKEKKSLVELQKKASVGNLQEKPELEELQEKASLEAPEEKVSSKLLQEKVSSKVLEEKVSLEVVQQEAPLEEQHKKPSLEVLHEKPCLEVLHERASLEVLHERVRRLEVLQEKPSLEERALLEEKASLEENVPEVTLPEATAGSSRVSRNSEAQETRENLSQTSDGCLTLYRTPPEGQETSSDAIGPSEQLVATLTKYLDAVVTELRVTNSRLACVLPNLEHAVKQPKQSREKVEAVSRSASTKSSRTSSGMQPARELADTASTKRLSPSPSVPSDHGDSDVGISAREGSEAQTSASWLQAQEQQLTEERRAYERRVIALERRLREVLSELHVTRCQLAEALTAQDFRGRQVPRIDVRSESSVSLVSSTMDAMLSTASVGSDDSDSETRSSAASVSPKSTCTVVYRTKRRAAASVSSASVAASDSFTSACTMVEDAVKDSPQDKKTRSSPAMSRSLLDIVCGFKAPQQQKRRPASETASESSFLSSVSESEARASDRRRAPSPTSNSWTEMSVNWLRAMQQLVQQLRTSPQQSQSSDETTPTPESLPQSSEEPGDTTNKQSLAARKSLERQPVSTTSSSEVSSADVRTSTRSLLSRMVNALLSTSSATATSVVDTRTSADVSKAPSVAVVPSKAETPGPASDHTSSEPSTEANTTGRSLLGRMMDALLPSSTPAADTAPPLETRSSGASKTVSDAAISSPPKVESTLSASAVVSRVSCMLGLSVERSDPAVPEEAAPPPRHWLLQVADRWLPTTCSPPRQPVS